MRLAIDYLKFARPNCSQLFNARLRGTQVGSRLKPDRVAVVVFSDDVIALQPDVVVMNGYHGSPQETALLVQRVVDSDGIDPVARMNQRGHLAERAVARVRL